MTGIAGRVGAAVFLAALVASGMARAEPIEGGWKVENGETVVFASCGGGAYCARVKTGKYAGQEIGRMSGSSPDYTGTITDPRTNKTYEGSATLAGNALKLTGCVAKIFCRSQNWTR